MDLLLQWALLASIQLAATISPGPAFAMTLRNAVANGSRRDGLLTSLGLGLGIGVHILLVIFGISLLISQSPLLYTLIQYAGAGYLIFIGLKSITAKRKAADNTETLGKIKNEGMWFRIQNGLLTNLLNPKALVFFTAVYTQFISPETPIAVSLLFLATSVFIEIGWFSAVTLFLTSPNIKKHFMSISHWIERVSGGLLIGLGVKLAIR